MTLWEYVHPFIYVSFIHLQIKMCLSLSIKVMVISPVVLLISPEGHRKHSKQHTGLLLITACLKPGWHLSLHTELGFCHVYTFLLCCTYFEFLFSYLTDIYQALNILMLFCTYRVTVSFPNYIDRIHDKLLFTG